MLNRVKCNLTQLTTRSKLHSLSGVEWRGVSVRVYCGGCLKRFAAQVLCWAVGCLPRVFSGSPSGQRVLCVLDVRLRMASWLWLRSAFGVVAFVGFVVFPGLVAGCGQGRLMGVSHRPGFGLLGSGPRSLSTQPPFATQMLTSGQFKLFTKQVLKFYKLRKI